MSTTCRSPGKARTTVWDNLHVSQGLVRRSFGDGVTPSARIASAIDLLDTILSGEPAEAVLTRWARASRFAGSGDRAAVRDLVYDSLRRLRTRTALAGADGPDGRALMIGMLREAGTDPGAVFTGERHAPPVLSPEERSRAPRAVAGAEALDVPDWLAGPLEASLGDRYGPVAAALRDRAPVILRANAARGDRDQLARALAGEAIATRPHPAANNALELTDNAARFKSSSAYLSGLAELQDAGPQAACESLDVAGRRVLDYCAGGGGKALALAARGARVWAHDAAPGRMGDLEARAGRAGVRIRQLTTAAAHREAPWDLVVLDVPCSGSGTWRRSPDAKWRLTAGKLAALQGVQAEILDQAQGLVGDTGDIAYMTCSLLAAKNGGQVRAFLARHPGWRLAAERQWTPLDGCDGFYLAHLTCA